MNDSADERRVVSLDPMFVFGGLFAAAFGGAAFGLFAESVVGTPRDVRVTIAGQIGLWIGMIGAVVLAARSAGTMSVPKRFGFSMRRLDVLWAALGPILQVAIGLAYRPFVDAAKLEKAAKDVTDVAKGQVIAYVALTLSVVVGAPIVEELFFRGLVLRAVTGIRPPSQARRSIQVIAVAVSAVLFGAIHFQLLQLPALVAFGAIAATLAVRFDRLGPSIWLHIGFNASTMATLGWQIFR